MSYNLRFAGEKPVDGGMEEPQARRVLARIAIYKPLMNSKLITRPITLMNLPRQPVLTL